MKKSKKTTVLTKKDLRKVQEIFKRLLKKDKQRQE